MRGIQLQALLEAMFTVQLPDELMFEPDATLRTLAMALVPSHTRTHTSVHCHPSNR